MSCQRRRPTSPLGPLAVLLAASAPMVGACGGQGSGDATPIPSTGVPVAAASARGVDVTTTTPPPTTPVDPFADPSPTSPPGMPTMPPHDPFAPPVSPPPVPPAPTGTGVPL